MENENDVNLHLQTDDVVYRKYRSQRSFGQGPMVLLRHIASYIFINIDKAMGCCLTAPSHYLRWFKCVIDLSKRLWYYMLRCSTSSLFQIRSKRFMGKCHNLLDRPTSSDKLDCISTVLLLHVYIPGPYYMHSFSIWRGAGGHPC